MGDPLEHPDTIVPIQRADAEFLFIVGGQDMNWKSKYFMDIAVDLLKAAEKSNYEVR